MLGISGLLKEQLLIFPMQKKFKAFFLEGEKEKVWDSKEERGEKQDVFQTTEPECYQHQGTTHNHN